MTEPASYTDPQPVAEPVSYGDAEPVSYGDAEPVSYGDPEPVAEPAFHGEEAGLGETEPGIVQPAEA